LLQNDVRVTFLSLMNCASPVAVACLFLQVYLSQSLEWWSTVHLSEFGVPKRVRFALVDRRGDM